MRESAAHIPEDSHLAVLTRSNHPLPLVVPISSKWDATVIDSVLDLKKGGWLWKGCRRSIKYITRFKVQAQLREPSVFFETLNFDGVQVLGVRLAECIAT